jgi:hypothetical protein
MNDCTDDLEGCSEQELQRLEQRLAHIRDVYDEVGKVGSTQTGGHCPCIAAAAALAWVQAGVMSACVIALAHVPSPESLPAVHGNSGQCCCAWHQDKTRTAA